MSNTNLGKYEQIDLLGTEAIAEVYQRRDRMLGREEALKVLRRNTTGTQLRSAVDQTGFGRRHGQANRLDFLTCGRANQPVKPVRSGM